MAFIVDPARFKAEGVLIDWVVVARRLHVEFKGQQRPALQLRWMTRGDLGVPTEPFVVWRRRKSQEFKPLAFSAQSQIWMFGEKRVTWPEGPMARVAVDLAPSGAGGAVYAYAGTPHVSNAVDVTSVPASAGVTRVVLSAALIDGLVVSQGLSVQAVGGVPADGLAQAPAWEKFEIVGLPLPLPEWNGLHGHTAQQGMVSALTTPQAAALQRLVRGGPQVGWQPNLPTGEPVPPWVPPSLPQLIAQEVKEGLLDNLKPVLPLLPPNQQFARRINVPLPPPANSSGKQMSGGGSVTHVAPLAVALMGAGTDPWLALALGYGTAYPAPLPGVTGAAALEHDYMVTARWERGLNGFSAPFEMAALVPAPKRANAPPPPAKLSAEMMGHLRPLVPDADWRCSVKASWDRPIEVELFRPRTFAFARAGTAPPAPAALLLQQRKSGDFRPLLLNSALPDPLSPEAGRVAAADRELNIPSATGTRGLRYGVCQQDIYGQWTPWATADTVVAQPPVDDVRIVTATLSPSLPAAPNSSVCPASLTIEFLWDWRIRRPEKIRFVGRLYAASYRGQPPPSLAVPAGLQRSLAGGGASLDITFSGNVPSAPGATFTGLSENGEQAVIFGPAQGNETRRYRVKLKDFSLDFAAAGHIGLALWANGQERVPPKRTGQWSDEPSVIAASDPRPPKMIPDVVTLASLPDAAGECHARLSWQASPNAAGYFVYETTETKILLANNAPEPAPEHTLSQRLTQIKQKYAGNPSRAVFTRRNDKPITSLSTDVTLPRGSTAVHVFVVIGVNAGQVESAWPTSADALQAIAAPRVMKPAPPTIEVRPVLDQDVTPNVYRAFVSVGARPGPRVKKVELFRVRVDDAAKELDTMGPARAVITGGGGGWDVESQTDASGTSIATVTGEDTPPGSWKRVWYRAAAWSEPDALRGYLAGRSLPSSAAWVVVPPSTPPNLSPLAISWPAGGGVGDVLLKWTSSAPRLKTPLGPHTLTVRAVSKGAPPLVEFAGELGSLPTAKPADGSGVWLEDAAGPSPFEYAAILRRPAPHDAAQFIVQLTDPLGRSSERTFTIPAGPVLPAPDLGNFVLTTSNTPPGKMLTWTSEAPFAPGGPPPYILRVTAFRPLGNLLLPVAVEMPLADVPLDEPGPVPPGTDALRVRRVPKPGRAESYYAFCRHANVKRFVVRLTSPDGRKAEKTVNVS